MAAGDRTVLTVIGSGTLVPDGSRGSAAHHLRTEHASVLLDCGSGAVHGLSRAGVAWQELTHVAISHYHVDHVGDLPALLTALEHGTAAPRTRPLTLVGPPGFRAWLEGLAAALGSDLLGQDFALGVRELREGRAEVDTSRGLTWSSVATAHTAEAIAYRLETPGGIVAYTGDTGPSDALADALSGADVLIAECTHPDPPPTDRHLTPRTLAELAAAVRPRLLLVTHVFPSHAPEEAVRRVRDRYDGTVVAAADGMVVRIGRDDVAVDPPGSR